MAPNLRSVMKLMNRDYALMPGRDFAGTAQQILDRYKGNFRQDKDISGYLNEAFEWAERIELITKKGALPGAQGAVSRDEEEPLASEVEDMTEEELRNQLDAEIAAGYH